MVVVGSSGSNPKTATASTSVTCPTPFQAPGYPDTFQIATAGTAVTARRIDLDSSWTANVQVPCCQIVTCTCDPPGTVGGWASCTDSTSVQCPSMFGQNQECFPTTPWPKSQQNHGCRIGAYVTFYENSQYNGDTFTLRRGNHAVLPNGWNDRISSLRTNGLVVTVYEHGDFQGRSKTFNADSYVGDDWNDVISSIIVQ